MLAPFSIEGASSKPGAVQAARAKAEGVSLNTLVLTFIAQGLGSSSPKPRARVAA